jgi:alanyl-tRNA synthetase
MRSAAEIRRAFLDFFAARGHRIVPSAPVAPADDPTLLFTNAGMNQFKDVFLGTGRRDYVRAADTQKCIRVSGKHNDLEEVGLDTYHHTFFEMLGNWSFGDYFKREAILWAWEFLTEEAGLDGSRLYATVFEGNADLGLPADEEAAGYWRDEVGLPAERVLAFGAKDNFWEMADTGPCGPCSEIHIDLGAEACDRRDVPGHVCRVNGDCGRYVEIWNLVFIQFNREADGGLRPLPANHVDTGMGFERLVAVVQGRTSNYDTDLFAPIFARLQEISGHRYGSDPARDIAFRVIADHARALCVAIADSVMPARDGRGYVLRRLLRRAARYGRQTLGIEGPFIHLLAPVVASIYEGVFPELSERLAHIDLVIEAEERSFARTIDQGITRFEALAERLSREGRQVIPGDEAYRLYHEGGFPRDLIDLMAREKGLVVNEEGWTRAEEEHRRRSEGKVERAELDLSELEGLPPTEFVGYPEQGIAGELGVVCEARLLKLIGREAVVLDRSPFYAEAGGQVGDTGVLEAPGFLFRVADTLRLGDIIVHRGALEKGSPGAEPETVTARVDLERRRRIMANHTATHLLHWALKEVLGGHANQQGSAVQPELLRFDFTHPAAISPEDLARIEELVNRRVAEDHPVQVRWMGLEEAKAAGATALFGEKYGERVRVITIGDFSKELCGGTHCRATGEIGAFRIQSESSIQAGVRRIIALTRDAAVRASLEERRILGRLAALLSCQPADLPERVAELRKQVKELKKTRSRQQAGDTRVLAEELLAGAEQVGDVRVIVATVDLPREALGELADRIRAGKTPVAGVLLTTGPRPLALGFATPALTGKPGPLHMGKVIKQVAGALGGGGGGRPDFAQGGGSKAEEIPAALALARRLIGEQLGS